MQIYNTMTRQKEELKPITPGTVKIYACGPTVYNLIHIGNARALCVFDTLRRYLEFRGYKVFYVQNFTDVDDKIIKRANEQGRTAAEVATEFSDKFIGVMRAAFSAYSPKSAAGLCAFSRKIRAGSFCGNALFLLKRNHDRKSNWKGA